MCVCVCVCVVSMCVYMGLVLQSYAAWPFQLQFPIVGANKSFEIFSDAQGLTFREN